MIHKIPKDLRPVVTEAIGRGCWELEETRKARGHHLRLKHESGRAVPLHCSRVSEALASRKLRSQLLRIERELTGST